MKFRIAVSTLIILVTLAGIHLYVYTQNIGLKFKARELKIKLGELKSKNRQLGYQVAQKENLNIIEEKAIQHLKMNYPKDINYILGPQASPEQSYRNASGASPKRAKP